GEGARDRKPDAAGRTGDKGVTFGERHRHFSSIGREAEPPARSVHIALRRSFRGHGTRLIDCRIRRPRPGGATCESVLSHFNDLRRHFQSSDSEPRTLGHAPTNEMPRNPGPPRGGKLARTKGFHFA